MTGLSARGNLLRNRQPHEHSRVTFVELFFDLVFVFAITQLSHSLLGHLSLLGAVQTLLLFMAVWWVWVYTSWCTNWLDPERPPVRLMLFALMLAGLVLSTSIPEAFASRGLAFAVAYVGMQIGRTLFMLWAMARRRPRTFRNFQRVLAWLVVAGMFWIAGGVADDSWRLALWGIALLLDYISPALGFRTPGLGRSTTTDWNDIEGGHLAERCGLFIIIALGESILVTGATFNTLEWSAATIAAFVVAFIGSVAMWWIYFMTGAERASHRIADSADPGRLARLAYTYIPLPLVAGIIVAAVADELVLMHPTGHIDAATTAVVLGGPALYLIGNLLFRRATTERYPLSHFVGLVLLAALIPTALLLSPLAFSAAATLVLVLIAGWETMALRHGGAAMAEPTAH